MGNLYSLNYFNFRNFEDKYLLTNDSRKFIFLKKDEFENLINYELKVSSELYEQLKENFFIFDNNKELFIRDISKEVRSTKQYLFERTQLHIFVLTVNCNLNCVYCQASVQDMSINKKVMNKLTAEKAVDIALQSPSNNLSFEFQGGEPLLNFDVIRHIVEYTTKKNFEIKKNISFNLVSNLTILTDEMLEFLIDNKVSISTSIDGPDIVHDYNRNIKGMPTLYKTKENIKKINEKYIEYDENTKVQAIQTTTRQSLFYAEEIVNQYIELGMNSIFIRPLTPIGFSILNWDKIGYSTEEFCEFYENCLDYIIELAKKGVDISEAHASIFLKKILTNIPVNYMELRSPCGGAIGQLAYNYDGDVYACDEARMFAESDDKSFKLGSVYSNTYEEIIDNPITKSICVSSCLESIPQCSDCAYNPYCGTCPVYNYIEQKTIFAKMPVSYKCKIYKGILDVLFKKIKAGNQETMNVFYKWIN